MSHSCALIGRAMRISAAACEDLRLASAMHDIGKIGIPDAVLLKPGALNGQERAMIERHPEIGHQILTGSNDRVMVMAATIALTHHERVDGDGYPQGMRGDQIPLAGRIAAVADVFDALTHDRVYRPALDIDEALTIVREGRGYHFDPLVLDAFEAVLSSVIELRIRFPDAVSHEPGSRYPAQPTRTVHAERRVHA